MCGPTLGALVILERLETSKGGASCDQFMTEAGFVLVEVVVLVDLLVVVFVLVCGGFRSVCGSLGECEYRTERTPETHVVGIVCVVEVSCGCFGV
jgi:hypothetical protein